ncbi:hypothetical protein LguiB_033721 [Lonicera macranthoides]
MSLRGKQSTFYQMINYSLKKIIPFLANSRDCLSFLKIEEAKDSRSSSSYLI